MPWPKSTKTVRIPKANLYSADCPTRIILDDVMSKWGSLLLVLLETRSYRFSELAYLIGGVSEKMLAQSLRRLEADGFVRRVVHATKPPRVEYSLTSLGCDLAAHLRPLLNFVQKHAGRALKQRQEAMSQGREQSTNQPVPRRSAHRETGGNP